MRSSKLRKYVLFAVGVGLLWSCADDDIDTLNDPSNQVVVEAYVYADEPIVHVRLSKIHAGGSAVPIPVNTANVRVVQGSNEYALNQVDTMPGMYVQADTSQLIDGYAPVELIISHEGREISAQAAMPAKVTGIQITDTLININPGDEDNVLAVVSWNPIENSKYVMSIRAIDSNQDLIGFLEYDSEDNPFLTVSSGNEVELKGAHFRYYGRYEIYVTAISPEYELFFDQLVGLSNAPSNIEGGLGIFAAFNGAVVKLHVQ